MIILNGFDIPKTNSVLNDVSDSLNKVGYGMMGVAGLVGLSTVPFLVSNPIYSLITGLGVATLIAGGNDMKKIGENIDLKQKNLTKGIGIAIDMDDLTKETILPSMFYKKPLQNVLSGFFENQGIIKRG